MTARNMTYQDAHMAWVDRRHRETGEGPCQCSNCRSYYCNAVHTHCAEEQRRALEEDLRRAFRNGATVSVGGYK